ncbi:MAG: transposase [Acidimicrobiia bacterium]|nr:transposase [Acidimicrobiia bacterium]
MTTRDASIDVAAAHRLDPAGREAPGVSQQGAAVSASTVRRMAPDPSDGARGAAGGPVGLVAFKFRLYPSPEAARLLERYAAAERAIYNRVVEYQYELRALQQRRRRHGGRMGLPRAEFDYSDINAWAKAEAPWLVGIPGSVRSQAERIAYRALVDSLRLQGRRQARFRRRGGGTDGFSWQAATASGEVRKINKRWHEVRLPRARCAPVVWCRVRVDTGREPPAAAYRAGKVLRITRDAAGTWWLTMTAPAVPERAAPAGSSCGLDLGVIHTLTLADHTGRVLHLKMLRPLSDAEARRLVDLQRSQSRSRLANPCEQPPCPHTSGSCWRTSRRYQRRRVEIAVLRLTKKKKNQDWIENVTTRIADPYHHVGVEDLSVRALTASAAGTVAAPGRNVAAKRSLNRGIREQRWATILRRLDDKVTARGGQLMRVRAANTSRRCHRCGHTAAANRTTRALFCCVACGHRDGADANAAQNIHDLALQGHPPARGGTATAPTGATPAETDAEARPEAADDASIAPAA